MSLPYLKKLRILTYLATFFLTVAAAFPAYLNSSFLKTLLNEEKISLVYSASSILTILITFYLPRLLNKRGNLTLVFFFSSLAFLATWIMVGVSTPFIILAAFALYHSLGFIIRYLLDLYLEQVSDDKNTGNIRGFALTTYNLSWLFSPLLATMLASSGSFKPIYILAALSFIPVILISLFLKEKRSVAYSEENLPKVFLKLFHSRKGESKNIYNILVVDFLLNLFYAVMVVYAPLYLIEHVGLPLPIMGFVFTIMLLPFVIFEYPLGKLADKRTGEKELLVLGLILIFASTALISFVVTTNIVIWTILLFFTRVGAATVEVMKETYLFKKIKAEDAPVLALSRTSSPASYIIGPLFVSIFLIFFDFRWLFLALGLVMSSGIWFAGKLRDTNE